MGVFKIQPVLPDLAGLYLFEYHPGAGKVYRVDLSSMTADVIAEHCDTPGRAYGFVQTWCRGFRAGQSAPPVLGGETR